MSLSDYSDNESFKSANDRDGHIDEDTSSNLARFPPEEEAVRRPSISSFHLPFTRNPGPYSLTNSRFLEPACRIKQAESHSKWAV